MQRRCEGRRARLQPRPRANSSTRVSLSNSSPLLTFDGDGLDAATRAHGEHRPDDPSGQASVHTARSAATEINVDVPEGLRNTPEPDRQGLAARPVSAHLRGHPARHPPGQERPLQPSNPRHDADLHRAARLPRRRDRQPRPGEELSPAASPNVDLTRAMRSYCRSAARPRTGSSAPAIACIKVGERRGKVVPQS